MTSFIKVKCECGNEQAVFSNAASNVTCNKCGAVLAESRGGKALIKGKEARELK